MMFERPLVFVVAIAPWERGRGEGGQGRGEGEGGDQGQRGGKRRSTKNVEILFKSSLVWFKIHYEL